MKVHITAIGGSVMHNLAICLKEKGFLVSGSDDEIFEPAKSRLHLHGLLPEKTGWDIKNITRNLDAVIVGMHAKADNPELIYAKNRGIKVYSYPEYVYEQSKNKKRIVIGGSHGKTTITAIILHVLKHCNYDFDYLVGAQLEGFDTMVKLTNHAPLIILEGDEYLTSPYDKRPKFHLYKPHIALLSGIAWDHINVFPTFENYVDQFKVFIDTVENEGKVVYFKNDKILSDICKNSLSGLHFLPYNTPGYKIDNGIVKLITGNGDISLQVFGMHNLQNIEGARIVCNQIGIKDSVFYSAVSLFKGASRRLELVAKREDAAFYKDFAHSPSKLKATINAVKEQYVNRELIACIELHTFSSLNKDFVNQYAGTMKNADLPIVYFNPHTLEHKKLPEIKQDEILAAFCQENLQIFNDSRQLMKFLKTIKWKNKNLLMMTSGNFDGLSEKELKQFFC